MCHAQTEQTVPLANPGSHNLALKPQVYNFFRFPLGDAINKPSELNPLDSRLRRIDMPGIYDFKGFAMLPTIETIPFSVGRFEAR